jgi:hypothetical protein
VSEFIRLATSSLCDHAAGVRRASGFVLVIQHLVIANQPSERRHSEAPYQRRSARRGLFAERDTSMQVTVSGRAGPNGQE